MAVDVVEETNYSGSGITAFDLLDKAHRSLDRPGVQQALTALGDVAVTQCGLVEPPEDLPKGWIATNPCGPESVNMRGELGEGDSYPFNVALARVEPAIFHLGATESRWYLVESGKAGIVQLKPYDAPSIPGEDARLSRFPIRAGNKRFNGVLGSTVEVTTGADNFSGVDYAQVFKWGTDINNLEEVGRLHGLKDTLLVPLPDGTILVIGRPHPHITWYIADSIKDVTSERIRDATCLTRNLLPAGAHAGGNGAQIVGDHLEISAHEAYKAHHQAVAELHYRAVRYAIPLSELANPNAQLYPIGVLATRSCFPDAAAKPEGCYGNNYEDIVYGIFLAPPEPGSRRVLAGLGDNRIGYATVARSF